MRASALPRALADFPVDAICLMTTSDEDERMDSDARCSCKMQVCDECVKVK